MIQHNEIDPVLEQPHVSEAFERYRIIGASEQSAERDNAVDLPDAVTVAGHGRPGVAVARGAVGGRGADVCQLGVEKVPGAGADRSSSRVGLKVKAFQRGVYEYYYLLTYEFQVVCGAAVLTVLSPPHGDERVESPGRRHHPRLADGADVGRKPARERVPQPDEGDVVGDSEEGQLHRDVERVVPDPAEVVSSGAGRALLAAEQRPVFARVPGVKDAPGAVGGGQDPVVLDERATAGEGTA